MSTDAPPSLPPFPCLFPCRNNGLDASCTETLGRALAHTASLTCLDLGCNALGHASADALAKGLPSSGLRDLRLDRNRLELQGACALVKVGRGALVLVKMGRVAEVLVKVGGLV